MRNPERLKKRDAKLLHRHNHLLNKKNPNGTSIFSYAHIIETLAEEFDLDEKYLETRIKQLSQGAPIVKPRKTFLGKK
jgi:hypothetical protein